MVIILSYKYCINSIEQCVNWYKCQIVIISIICAKTKMFSCHSSTFKTNITIISFYLDAYKTIEDIYGTYSSHF